MEYKGVLVGLGNPGPQYAGTRHNMGFLFVSALLAHVGREGQLAELNGSRFACELYRVRLSQLGGVWLAAMPLTFMNESGRCVQPLLAWHKLAPSCLVVAHDELDIPAGALRFKRAGGNAGHNGLKSIAECLGTQDFFRLRMGIGRPPHKGDALNWVLGRPDETDAGLLLAMLPKALDVLFAFAGTGLEAAARLARR
jgi:PTH1 family peptidyl-tRNA hydrolase